MAVGAAYRRETAALDPGRDQCLADVGRAEHGRGDGHAGQNLTFAARLENAICAYGVYLEKAFWPHPLAIFYPYTTHKAVDVAIIGLALVAISIAVCRMAQHKPYLPVGWWWYIITLLPVIGLVQVGDAIDRRPLHVHPADRAVHHRGLGFRRNHRTVAVSGQGGRRCRGRCGTGRFGVAYLTAVNGLVRQRAPFPPRRGCGAVQLSRHGRTGYLLLEARPPGRRAEGV